MLFQKTAYFFYGTVTADFIYAQSRDTVISAIFIEQITAAILSVEQNIFFIDDNYILFGITFLLQHLHQIFKALYGHHRQAGILLVQSVVILIYFWVTADKILIRIAFFQRDYAAPCQRRRISFRCYTDQLIISNLTHLERKVNKLVIQAETGIIPDTFGRIPFSPSRFGGSCTQSAMKFQHLVAADFITCTDGIETLVLLRCLNNFHG